MPGDSLEVMTHRFIDTVCGDMDKRFRPDKQSSYEWETLDLCEFVKYTWTHASITSMYGSHIFSIWPGIETWIWDFDQNFQKIVVGVPRFMAPKAYALRGEGNKMFQLWDSEAITGEAEGKIGNDPEWNPYWGLRYAHAVAKYLMKQGISPQGRGGVATALIWAVSHLHVSLNRPLLHDVLTTLQLTTNAVPVAMQVINQAVLNPSLLTELRMELSECQTRP